MRTEKTGKLNVARAAAKALANPRTSKYEKSVAASALTQTKLPFPVKSYPVKGATLTQHKSELTVRKVASKR